MLLLSRKRMPVVLAIFIFSFNAQAQSFEAELKRVAQLRQAFGDALVSALTNLPPNEYPAARQKALAMAEQVTKGSLAREDARSTLCAAFTKGAGGCPEVSIALSGVDKSELEQADLAAAEPQALPENSPETAPEAPVGEAFSEAALSAGALENVESDGMAPIPAKSRDGEAELDSLDLPDSAATDAEPALEAEPASAEASVAKPRSKSVEPELEAENTNDIDLPGRELSSEASN